MRIIISNVAANRLSSGVLDKKKSVSEASRVWPGGGKNWRACSAHFVLPSGELFAGYV